MACVPTPTDTLFGTVVAANEVTTFTQVFTTLPPVVTTVFTQTLLGSCPDVPSGNGEGGDGGGGAGGDGQCQTLTVPVVSTLDPGGQTVLQVTVISTTFVTTEIPTLTLFDSCPPTGPPTVVPPPPPPPPSTSSSSSVTSSPTTTSPSSSTSTTSGDRIPTLITPIDTVATQVPTTLPEGPVILTWITSTHTYSPTTITIPSPTGHESGQQNNTDHDGDSRNVLAPVLGGVLGGFFILITLVCLIWFAWRRRKSIFRTAPQQNMSLYASPPLQHALEPDPEPMPYEYGLVGRASSHPSRGTSLSSLGKYDSYPLTAQAVPPSAWPGSSRPTSSAFDGSDDGGSTFKRPVSLSLPTQQLPMGAAVPAQVQGHSVDVGSDGNDPPMRRPKSMLYVVNEDRARSPPSSMDLGRSRSHGF